MSEPLLVMSNVPDRIAADTIARALLEQKLAACVNILPAVRSIYRWQGTIEEADEITLLIKSTREAFGDMELLLRTMHPYEVPEIIAVPICAGLPAYLDWIVAETRKNVDV